MGALLATLGGSIASFFALFMAKKTAVGVAAVAVFSALTVALMAAFVAAINAVLGSLPLPDAFVFGFWYFMPDNFPACFSAIVSAHAAAAVYRWNVANLHFIHSAS